MGRGDLGFLAPMFDLAGSLIDDDDVENMSFGVGEIGAESPLSRDDADLRGAWVSMAVTHSISAALDHVITLRTVVCKAQEVTINAPWTLLRGALEPASIALWVLTGNRDQRRERALRVWVYDYKERQQWEQDTGDQPVAPARTGRERAAELCELAKIRGLRVPQVSARLNYGRTVAAAAEAVGWDRAEATARWREASAFAHGRTWPLLRLTSPQDAEVIRGGIGLHLTIDESRVEALARLTTDILHGAVDEYARLSNDGHL